MQQVIVIHGGETFPTYDAYLAWLKGVEFDRSRLGQKKWKSSLQERLGPAFDVLSPLMPNSLNAKYEEWHIWFEKVLAVAGNDLILLGHSLGGIFLAKYLAMQEPTRTVKATLLVAAPYGDKTGEYTMADFSLPHDLSKMQARAGAVHLIHSSDDPVVPFSDMDAYKAALPSAVPHVFHDRGHFNQEEFPEIVELIRNL